LNHDHLRILLAEIERRKTQPKFVLDNYCFKEQIDFISDSSRFKTAVCSRRAGKTISCAVHLLDHARSNPGRVCLYITLDRKNAKRIIWRDITKINSDFNLGFRVDNQELSLTHSNGSVIYISGAKDKSEIEKYRGLAISLVYIDECQSFRSYIEDLVDDVLGAALYDYNGTLCLIGTPGAVPAGYFYQATQSDRWSHHSWTMFQNPHLEQKSGRKIMELVEEDMTRMGVTIEHPKIQRECFGRWVIDTESLVLKYDSKKNHYDFIQAGNDWSYIIGVDIGWHDSDAIAVIGWRKHTTKSYLIKELVKPKQGITELANQLKLLYAEYQPLRIVMDTGGLGKKIAEELTMRHALPISAAEKTRKFEFLELLADALSTESMLAPKTSSFAQDCALTEWDMEAKAKGVLKINDRYHSDIIDAVLYAFRESLHWIEQPAPKKFKVGSPEHFEQIENDHFESVLKQMKNNSSDNEEDFI